MIEWRKFVAELDPVIATWEEWDWRVCEYKETDTVTAVRFEHVKNQSIGCGWTNVFVTIKGEEVPLFSYYDGEMILSEENFLGKNRKDAMAVRPPRTV